MLTLTFRSIEIKPERLKSSSSRCRRMSRRNSLKSKELLPFLKPSRSSQLCSIWDHRLVASTLAIQTSTHRKQAVPVFDNLFFAFGPISMFFYCLCWFFLPQVSAALRLCACFLSFTLMIPSLFFSFQFSIAFLHPGSQSKFPRVHCSLIFFDFSVASANFYVDSKKATETKRCTRNQKIM